MKQRLEFFDMIKGIAILMVIMAHIVTMGIRGIDQSFIFRLFRMVHMPLFFFIAGWFTYRVSAQGAVRLPQLGKRAERLLLPMVAVSTLWIFAFAHTGLQSPMVSTFEGLWTDSWKNGYWFTFVLFELIVLYALLARPLQACNSLPMQCIVAVGAWVVLQYFIPLLPTVAGNILCCEHIILFFPVFFAGVLCRRHEQAFFRLCANGTAITVAIAAGSVAFCIAAWPWNYSEWVVSIANVILHLCLCLVVVQVFRTWAAGAFAKTPGAPLARMWSFIGRRSLAVYLLHYFLLFPLGNCRAFFLDIDLAFVPMIIFTFVIAMCIIGVVLIIDYILSFSPLLSLLLTGGGHDPKPLSVPE